MSALSRLLTFGLLCTTVIPFTVLGQSKTSAASGFDALTFTITVPARQFLVLEPVPITLRLENRTSEGILGHAAIDLSSSYLSLRVQPEGQAEYAVSQLSMGQEFRVVTPRIIPPGAKREVEEVFDFQLDRVLPQPGRYAMRFVLYDVGSSEQVSSNRVSVQLREPTGLEAAAQEYIKATKKAHVFFTGFVENSVPDYLEQVANNFSGTVYADYANYTLGRINALPEAPERARAYFAKVASKRDFPLAARAAQRLADLPPR